MSQLSDVYVCDINQKKLIERKETKIGGTLLGGCLRKLLSYYDASHAVGVARGGQKTSDEKINRRISVYFTIRYFNK